MANVIILDPARFNSDLVGGTRRYIRTAFFDQGYGVSERFSGYARGAGIVPDTAPFSTIGLGTSGSPLRMSQFSGLTIPPLVLDTFTLTAGIGSLEVVKGDDVTTYGYLGPDYPNFGGGTSPAGSLNDYTFAPTNSTIVALMVAIGFGATLEFWVAGEHPNSGWTTMTIYHSYSDTTTVLNRTDFGFDSNPASEGFPAYSYWIISSSNIFSNTTSGQNTYSITIE
jgi:hypothetical protein